VICEGAQSRGTQKGKEREEERGGKRKEEPGRPKRVLVMHAEGRMISGCGPHQRRTI